MSRFEIASRNAGPVVLRSLMAAAVALALASPLAAQDAADPYAGIDVGALSSEDAAFLHDDAALNLLGMSPYNLGKSLRGKSAEDVARAVGDLRHALGQARYREGPDSSIAAGQVKDLSAPRGDWAEIPLNTQAANYGAGAVERPREFEKQYREPGVFSLKQYFGQRGGVPTFNHAPVALRIDDIVASKVDVTFVGVPSDNGSGWRDAVNAPNVMRSMFLDYATSGYDIYLGIDPTQALTLADFGNIALDKMSVELSVDRARQALARIAGTGTTPFVIGGDNAVTYSTVAALSEKHGKNGFTVVRFGAHFDGLRDLDHTITDEQALSALIRDGFLDGKDLIQVGIRSRQVGPQDLEWMRAQGIRSHSMSDVVSRGWEAVSRDVLAQSRKARKGILVSFDMSVLDPAYGTAAGRPAANGLTMREVAPLVRELCSQNEVVGFELLDVAPYLDLSYQSAYNANEVMNTCLSGIAYRRTHARKD